MSKTGKEGVSIVIPTYHRNETLRRAVSSALTQTYEDIEVLVIDDNSPESAWRESTQEILAEFSGDPRLRILENERNMGGAASRNRGIQEASYEYIAFLDDDDEYMPERIERQLPAFLNSENEKLALVFCDAEMTFDRDTFMCYSRPRYQGNCLFLAMRDNCLAATSQWMAKKSALLAVGMFDDVPSKQDSTLILKLLAAGYEVDYVPEVLSKYCFYSLPKISGTGMKNYQAERAYYSRCLALFDRLTEEEQEEVRYSFARIFRKLSKANGDGKRERAASRYMMRKQPIRTIEESLREGMRKARWAAFPNGLPGKLGRE